MILGQKGFDLIRDFEKLRLVSYLDQAGVWTIGWGTTRLNGYPVKKGMVINELVADALFLGDIEATIKSINDNIKKNSKNKLNQNQIDALISLAYNIGISGFKNSTLLKVINNHDFKSNDIYKDLFTRWNKVTDPSTGKKYVSNGLINRRNAEYTLFRLPIESE